MLLILRQITAFKKMQITFIVLSFDSGRSRKKFHCLERLKFIASTDDSIELCWHNMMTYCNLDNMNFPLANNAFPFNFIV